MTTINPDGLNPRANHQLPLPTAPALYQQHPTQNNMYQQPYPGMQNQHLYIDVQRSHAVEP